MGSEFETSEDLVDQIADLADENLLLRSAMKLTDAELAELRAENARLKEAGQKMVAYNKEHFDKARAEHQRAEDLTTENARLREALEWTADAIEEGEDGDFICIRVRDALEGKGT